MRFACDCMFMNEKKPEFLDSNNINGEVAFVAVGHMTRYTLKL